MDTSTAVLWIAVAFTVGVALGRQSGVRAGPETPPPPPDPGALEKVRPILRSDGKIAAIRVYRELTGAGLRDAKLAVETLHDDR